MPGIVVVTYNSAESIGSCLDACLQITAAEVVVVDNASEDNTVDEVKKRPSVRLLANSANRGFAAAVNQGFQMLSTPAVLVLNPDTILVSGVPELEHAVTTANVAAATGTLLNKDGSPQHGFNVRGFPEPVTLVFELLGLNRLWPSNPVNRRYRVRLESRVPLDVDQPAGAFLMVRREAWQAIGGFDEQFYPVWFEDVDFCKRLRKRGFRILYVPAAKARHTGGDSVRRMRWLVRQQAWYGSLLRYASKHFSRFEARVVAVAVIIGCFARATGKAITEFGLEPFGACSKVVRLSSLYLRQGERRDTYKAACSTTKESKSRF